MFQRFGTSPATPVLPVWEQLVGRNDHLLSGCPQGYVVCACRYRWAHRAIVGTPSICVGSHISSPNRRSGIVVQRPLVSSRSMIHLSLGSINVQHKEPQINPGYWHLSSNTCILSDGHSVWRCFYSSSVQYERGSVRENPEVRENVQSQILDTKNWRLETEYND